MDDGTPIQVKITIDPTGETAEFDFTGTGLEGLHYFNAPSAISKSATMYVLCCLINQDIPLDEGYLLPITFNIPAGTILNPSGKAAVCLSLRRKPHHLATSNRRPDPSLHSLLRKLQRLLLRLRR